MKLTAAQKSAIRRAVAEHLAAYVSDNYGEPLKDVEQAKCWPTTQEDDDGELDDACFDYLNTAAKQVAAALRKMR